MSVSYSIRIEFDKKQEKPERVFHAMALYVEGFNELQESFVKGYGNDIEFSSCLGATREGSCIADVFHRIKDIARGVGLESIFNGIYSGVRSEIAVAQKIDSEADVRSFANSVCKSIAANDPEYTNFTCLNDPNLYDVANALHKIHKAKQNLSEKDLVQYGRGLDFDSISESFSCPRDADQIFEDKVENFPSNEIFIVRRPSYVEDLKWEFECNRRKNKKLSAKMLDSGWLTKWLNHEEEMWPGDALYVKVRMKRKTNAMKKTKDRYESEIIEVIRVIPQNEVEQFTLDFEND
ncbi:hypothetical protein [Pseudoalteromonas rhizosphaerae]|uniref:hypothetical protein n=1 Tax=Pseudoalteromonas rhizosphaerae TaxID=2518973 RepID=UPI00237F5397|nr:hypothetical protein [Pseudoalteromonas rhizosphaerae]